MFSSCKLFVFSHFQSLQRKHQSLLQRIDELDLDCEELREKLMDIEGERDEIQDTLDKAKKKNEKLSKEFSEKQVRYIRKKIILR